MKASANIFPLVEFAEAAAPATPAAGQVRIYAKADGLMYSKDDAGVETALGGGGGGTGDVVGPASSTDSHVALFDGITGKLLKDGGALGTAAFSATGAFATAAQGATADSAVQPGDLATIATTGDVGDLTGLPGGTSTFLRADGTFAAPAGGGDVVGPASAVDDRIATFDTTTGKLIQDGGKTIAELRAPAIQAVTSSATVTPTFSDDMVKVAAQAVALALANPTGTPIPGLGMVIRIKDDGTARAITYDTQYRAIGITLPTTTVISKTTYIAMIYNSDDTTWDCIATGTQA